MAVRLVPTTTPLPPRPECEALGTLLRDGVTWGDSEAWLPALPADSIDLWFTSPPYADARPYSRIHPDRYVEWFLPYSKAMLLATKPSGWFVLNIKNRVARSGPLTGQRHPYVLVLALQHQGWRWIETYIWVKPNAVPGRFGPRTKDSFEYVYAFTKGPKPYFDLESVRVPYTAAMPEGLAEFFIRACAPVGGVVIDPFAGSGTTIVVARRLGRRAGGLDIHADHVEEAKRRIADDRADDPPGGGAPGRTNEGREGDASASQRAAAKGISLRYANEQRNAPLQAEFHGGSA